MSFLDQLGAKITDIGTGASQQAKNGVDTIKLNNTISAEKQKVSEYYRQIGEAYYNANADAPVTDYEELFAAIKNSLEVIQASQNKIEKLKGIRVCPECGAQIIAGAQFCSACGKPIKQETAEDSIDFCPHCGNPIKEGANFCTFCGKSVNQS